MTIRVKTSSYENRSKSQCLWTMCVLSRLINQKDVCVSNHGDAYFTVKYPIDLLVSYTYSKTEGAQCSDVIRTEVEQCKQECP